MRAVNLDMKTVQRLEQASNLLHAGKHPEAMVQCHRIAGANANSAAILHICAQIAQQCGRLETALQWSKEALARDASNSEYEFAMGKILFQMYGVDPAIACFKEVLKKNPDHVGSCFQLGLLHQAAGNLSLSRDCFKRYIELRPDDWRGMVNLCLVLRELGELTSARFYGERATSLKPDSFEAWHNLGNVYKDMQRHQAAAVCYKKALALNPDNDASYTGLGIAHQHNGALDLAENAFESALRRNPNSGTAVGNLLNMAMMACDWDRFRTYAKKIHELTLAALQKGELPAETPFVNLTRCNNPEINHAVARAWSRDIGDRMSEIREQLRFRYPEKRRGTIRIGYLSNNFGDHPTAHITRRLYRLHDRSRFEIACYSFGPKDDSRYRRAIQDGCDHFYDICDLSHAQAAKAINDHGVDILVDLVGFMKGQRLAIAALRPAPLQVRWLGMAGTSGADFFDYLISDRTVTPDEQAAYYTEKFIYLPHCYQINDNRPYEDDIDYHRLDFGLPEDVFVFCCFNTSYKIDEAIFSVWMNILQKTPRGVIWLLDGPEKLKLNLRKKAVESGIAAERLVFSEKLPKPKHLARLSLADLVLDTFRVSGAASTSDALWAGVPVLTIQGNHFASRMSSSILKASGLPDLVTFSLNEYENRAIEIATKDGLIERIKGDLKISVRNSHLFETEAFVKNLEDVYEIIWERYLNGEKPTLVNAFDGWHRAASNSAV